MLWVMLIIYILILTVYVSIQIIFEKKEKKKSQIAVNAIVVLLLFPLIQFGINYTFHYSDRQKQEEFQAEVIKDLIALGQKEIDLKKVQEIIAKTHRQVFNSIPKEAERWAADFVSALPQKKEQYELINEKKKEYSDKSLMLLPQLFDYTLAEFDARVLELNKIGVGSNIIKEPLELIINMDTHNMLYKDIWVRRVDFNNGNSIDVVLKPGRIENNEVKFYPDMRFIALLKKSSSISFGVNIGYGGLKSPPVIPDINYRINRDPLTEGFRSGLSKNLNQLFEYVLAQ